MKYILIILLMLIPFTVSAQMPGPPPLTGLTGDNVVLDTTNFDNNLGPGDDTTQKALDTLDDAAGGSGISYSNAQAMFTDNDDGTWDTVESQVVRYGINNLIWAKLSTILGGTDITADVSTPGQVTLNYSGTSIALSDFIEGIGIEIDTSETGLAYFDIDYTVLPSLSSFVDSDSVTWNTSEVGVVIATASGGISLGDVQNMVVDSESVTWDTSETGVMIATATAPSFSTETYLNIMSSNASGICGNLKGLWGMTGATTVLEDLSYAIHSGTLEGGLTFATDRSAKNMGYTTLFNGTTDYIDLGDSDDFSFGNGAVDMAFSVCFVVTDDYSSQKRIVTKTDYDNIATDFEYFIQNDSIILYVLNTNNKISATLDTTPSSGTHFLSFTYDGSSSPNGLKIYVDGILGATTNAETGTYTAMSNTNAKLYIGAAQDGASANGYYDGSICFSSIEKSEMTASEVFRLWKLVQGVYGL